MTATTTQLSGYRLMWILVMFDLPTDTKQQRKAASGFRDFLLDEGFERSQFSVYARFVNGKEAFATRVGRIERHLPDREMSRSSTLPTVNIAISYISPIKVEEPPEKIHSNWLCSDAIRTKCPQQTFDKIL